MSSACIRARLLQAFYGCRCARCNAANCAAVAAVPPRSATVRGPMARCVIRPVQREGGRTVAQGNSDQSSPREDARA